MDLKERALCAHEEWGGKIEVIARCQVNSRDDLSVAYTPGVAEPCLKMRPLQSLCRCGCFPNLCQKQKRRRNRPHH